MNPQTVAWRFAVEQTVPSIAGVYQIYGFRSRKETEAKAPSLSGEMLWISKTCAKTATS